MSISKPTCLIQHTRHCSPSTHFGDYLVNLGLTDFFALFRVPAKLCSRRIRSIFAEVGTVQFSCNAYASLHPRQAVVPFGYVPTPVCDCGCRGPGAVATNR